MQTKYSFIVSFIILLLLSSCFMSPLVSAKKRVTVLDNFQFDEPLNNVDEAVVIIPFNVTLSSANATFIVTYENNVNGTKTTETFTKEVDVFLHGVRLSKDLFEPFAQEFLVSIELSDFEKGFHRGRVVLLGTGQFRYYGSVSMYLETPSSKGLKFIGLDLWFWIMVIASPGILAVVIFMRRRRRRRLEEI